MMKSRLWLGGYFLILILILGIAGKSIYDVDPFFHYHKPDTKKYYYPLNNQRSQNDGISRHFDYDALITGTSMAENFRTSEMDALFETNSIKIPFSGGSFWEIDRNLRTALKYNSHLRIIVRGLDMLKFDEPADNMRSDLGKYPLYLYDENPLNDVYYLFNKSILFERVYPMNVAAKADNFIPGITPFDSYSNWQLSASCGVNAIYPEGIHIDISEEEVHLTEEEKVIIDENIYNNVVSLAEEYPDVSFYYFFTPYSIMWWAYAMQSGDVYRRVEAEQYVIEKILQYDNIKLFSFNMRTDITTDLNNYKDYCHYSEWISSLILKWMQEGKYQLTKDNYQQYIANELAFYTSYDFESLNEQEDYEVDLYASALLNQELTGAEPIILCPYFSDNDTFSMTDADNYNYLTFYAKKNFEQNDLSVYVYNDQTGEMVSSFTKSGGELDDKWHQYVLDISQTDKNFTIVINDAGADAAGNKNSSYLFKDVMLY